MVKCNAKDKKQIAFCTSLLMMLSMSETQFPVLGAPCTNCGSFIVCANRTGTPGNTFSPLSVENFSTVLYIQKRRDMVAHLGSLTFCAVESLLFWISCACAISKGG